MTAESPSVPPPHRILVVDTEADHDCADSLRDLLALCSDWEVGVAYDAADAVAQTLSNPPDAVLLDIEGAGTDRLDVVDRLRAALAGRPARFVVVTGSSAIQREAAHDARFAKAFMKPADPVRLLRTLAAD
jgi:CheY-like chemotaxis protein